MKKFIFFALAAILSVALISCNNDDDDKYTEGENAVTLEGTWKGKTIITHEIENEKGETTYEEEEVNTTIQFVGNPDKARYGTKGTGRWSDEYDDGTYSYNRTEWEVDFVQIIIKLLDNDGKPTGTVLYIKNDGYSLSNNLFSGKVDYDGDMRGFAFERKNSYNWGD
ncbi:hypothetical protein E5358_10210 [Palleniella muris]|uniref:Uncharacterized protein n=1 Tax=Palleniella muris TaxID=3038145 RepID=A0AC61QP36_9BACT|nr:hypothetical protein [Palleniella muris]TGX81499.1 hypothetical protein E5358_10210 [Palleniella muris]